MKQSFSVTLPYPPSVNAMYATFKGRRLLSREGRDYKRQVHLIARAAKAAGMFVNDVALTVYLYRPRKSGDLDNRLKAIQDALTGIWYDDDRQVVEIHAYRFDDKANPRAEVEIREI